ncbi:MAG: hypothetical protein LC540_19640 [Candidatus Thiodiazotropha sp.]|nr:hypothetical protein [Candidatus Thiodiazotropha sp.]
MIDVTFTLEKRQNYYEKKETPGDVDIPGEDLTEENILEASTHASHLNTLQNDANGIAFAVKFVNDEDSCPRTVKDFDSLIKVPRVYDVAVVKCSVGNNTRKIYMVGQKADVAAESFLSKATISTDKTDLYVHGYKFGPSGEAMRGLDAAVTKHEST